MCGALRQGFGRAMCCSADHFSSSFLCICHAGLKLLQLADFAAHVTCHACYVRHNARHIQFTNTSFDCFQTGLSAGTALLNHACMPCRRADIVAAQYVAATEGTLSPELPFEPISLRLRHRHGSHEALPPDDSWTQLQLEAEMLNL